MEEIFISYRRKDSQDATGRIHDHLDVFFGKKIAFRDIDDIPIGTQFPEELDNALKRCKLFIVVIGPDWLNVKDDNGRRRLDDPQDYVHQEVARALERVPGIPVIPILVSHAAMPKREDLPPNLKKLATINAVYAPPDHSFYQSMLALAKRISNLTGIPHENYWETLEQCQKIGLSLIKKGFDEDDSSLAEIENSQDLLVIQNDGRGWIDSKRELLLARLTDPRKTTRIVLYHPQSKFLPILVRKNNKTLQQQKLEIKRSFDILHSVKAAPGAMSLRGHHGFNPYSLLISDTYAFVSPYHYHEAGKLPLFKFTVNAREPLYKTLREDASRLFDEATPLESEHFLCRTGSHHERNLSGGSPANG